MSAWLESIPGVIVGTIVGGLAGGVGLAIHNSCKAKPLVPMRKRQAQEILSFAPLWFDEHNQVMTNEFLALQQYRQYSPDKFDQAGRLTDAFLASYNDWTNYPNTLGANQVKKAHELWFHIMSKLTSFETDIVQNCHHLKRNLQESSLTKDLKHAIHSINFQLECCCRQMQSLAAEKEMLEKRRAQWHRQQQQQQMQQAQQQQQKQAQQQAQQPQQKQAQPQPQKQPQQQNPDSENPNQPNLDNASSVAVKSPPTTREIPDYLTG